MSHLNRYAATFLVGILSIAACKSLGTPEDQEEADDLLHRISDYRQWDHFEGLEGIMRGKSPHGPYIRTFINSVGAADQGNPAYGTIIVKENFSKDEEASLVSKTIMQRIEGYDPENEDWFWTRYTAKNELTHSGKVAFCSDCHFDAGGDDFVFLND